jgi:renalase
MWDVAIIGAGLSGIACGRALRVAGYTVCILDKSRGLGGRMATRRVDQPVDQQPVDQQPVDHGLRYWQPASAALKALTEELVDKGVLKPWLAIAYEIRQRGVLTPIAPAINQPTRYGATAGMSAIAKSLLQDFTLGENWLAQHKALSLSHQGSHWQIECEAGQTVSAKRCVIAIPAPQAAELLQNCAVDAIDTDASGKLADREDPLANHLAEAIAALNTVTYFPCITVLAGYDSRHNHDMGELDPKGWMVTDFAGTSTDWTGLDSSKRASSESPVIVIHSKATFAEQYIDAGDLQPAASVLLRANARKFASWIAQPEWFQIHRWCYAQVNEPYRGDCLAISPTLICGGDWCQPPNDHQPALQSIDYAYQSGLAMAEQIHAQTL